MPSLVVCVVVASAPPMSAASSTNAGSPFQAVAAASAAAAGGRMSECTVSHAEATAGTSDAVNSMTASNSATTITHHELSPDSEPGSGPINPIRAARPTIPTVAYRLSP